MSTSLKISLNRRPVNGPWGGGNLFLRAFCDIARIRGHEVVHNLSQDIDVVFIMDPRPGAPYSLSEVVSALRMWPHIKVIHRVNECDARKGTTGVDKMLKLTSAYSNASVFVSQWLCDHLADGWLTENRHVVYNGVDSEVFRPTKGFDNGKVNIVAHHWSDNPMKGLDIYEALDRWIGNHDDYTFTYIGRHKGNLPNTRVIPPLWGKDLGNELARHDVYVSGSRFDPGPNHIIEPLACGLPTFVHVDGGGAVEFVSGKTTCGSYNTFDELIGMIKSVVPQRQNQWMTSWEDCVGSYLDIIEGL